MQVLEKILKEIDAHAIEFEMFGISDDYISVGWVKEIIRNHMNDGWVSVEERLPMRTSDEKINESYQKACVDKLAEYETAEEEGRLVVLPCDTVYFIWNKSSGISHVREKSILDLSLREILGIDKDGRYWSAKEEAEKALKEMKIK